MSLEMAPQDGPAERDCHVGPRSHSGASRDQYGVIIQVRFSTVLGKDRTSPYLYGTVRYGTVEISRIRRTFTSLILILTAIVGYVVFAYQIFRYNCILGYLFEVVPNESAV